MLNPLNFISKLVKSSNQKKLDKLKRIVEKVNSLEEKFIKIDDNEFPKVTIELKNKIKENKSMDEILPEAFALVREASKRVRSERHFDVQIMGGIVLHQGKIAEMKQEKEKP